MMKVVRVKITGIKWDTDGLSVPELPKRLTVALTDVADCKACKREMTDDEMGDLIGEYLTARFGWCHNGFRWEWVKREETKKDREVRKVMLQVAKMCAEAVDKGDADKVGGEYWAPLEKMLYKLAK